MLFVYAGLAVLVILLSLALSVCVDTLDKATNLSGAFLGGVLLAAVTSLPELFTSLAAVAFLNEPQMVVGNILGSNLFNLAALAAVSLLLFRRVYSQSAAREQRLPLMAVLLIYALLAILTVRFNIYFAGLNIVSWLIFLLNALGVRSLSAEDEDASESAEADAGRLLIRFAGLAALLVLTSIALTLVTEQLKLAYDLETSLAGALFLGVATSLPELVSTIQLVRLGNFNAACGNILGSNLFNFSILALSDLLYTAGTIYIFDEQAYRLLALGALAVASMLPVLYARRGRWKLLGFCLALLCYAVFLLI